jgi:hypothetical protein
MARTKEQREARYDQARAKADEAERLLREAEKLLPRRRDHRIPKNVPSDIEDIYYAIDNFLEAREM